MPAPAPVAVADAVSPDEAASDPPTEAEQDHGVEVQESGMAEPDALPVGADDTLPEATGEVPDPLLDKRLIEGQEQVRAKIAKLQSYPVKHGSEPSEPSGRVKIPKLGGTSSENTG